MTHTDIAINLRLLCGFAPSISDACRQMNMNRQQFTKYLNGQSRPSRQNMRRICDYFGLEEYELQLPSQDFTKIIALRPRSMQLMRALGPAAKTIDDIFTSTSPTFDPYLGYWHYYYFTPSRSGMIRRSLLRFSAHEGVVNTRLCERIQPEESPLGRSHFIRYVGLATIRGGRIFIVDHDAVDQQSLSQTILLTSGKGQTDVLTGMTIGVQGREARLPFAAQVFLTRLNPRVSLRAAMAQTGIFVADSPELPRHVSRMLSIGGREPQVLTAIELPV